MSADTATTEVLRQHLIDPEICIRCNTCEETCPVDAITHDSTQLRRRRRRSATSATSASRPARPARSTTGGRSTVRSRTRSPSSSAGTACPARRRLRPSKPREMPADVARITSVATAGQGGDAPPAVVGGASVRQPLCGRRSRRSRRSPATSASTADGATCDIRHIVLDFGGAAFPVLEGQTIGILPPGVDAIGQAASRAPVLGGKSTRGRAAPLQQFVAHREARHRGSQRRTRRGDRVELPVRPREGRSGQDRRTVRHDRS